VGVVVFEDTIAALATAPGRGAIAIVRVSGPDSAGVLRRVCPSLGGTLPEPRRQLLLSVRHPDSGDLLDRGLVTWFHGPRSYTGEDTVEIATHGGALAPQLVLDAVLAAGARHAERGEFTRRAVYHGRMDVLQAEAVADVVDGRSPAFHRAAVHQMERGLSRTIESLRGEMLRVEGLIAYGIDFPEEDEPPVSAERIRDAARAVRRRIGDLVQTAGQGEMLREGALVVLAGPPNSGKSSLFNRLVGTERAIVTAVPGTTRDAIEATISIDGYPFRLVDTAGLRDSEDFVEELGIEVARRYVGAADIVLSCADISADPSSGKTEFLHDADPSRTVELLTKADLAAMPPGGGDSPALRVSARTGEGLPELRSRLLEIGFGGILGDPGEQPIITRARHARALRAAAAEIESFLEAWDRGTAPEFAATHLRAAAGALDALIGAITPDDVLGEIFSSFCVGK
jgi:tRNA modification GTPase